MDPHLYHSEQKWMLFCTVHGCRAHLFHQLVELCFRLAVLVVERVECLLELRIRGIGFEVWGLGFGVRGLGFRV